MDKLYFKRDAGDLSIFIYVVDNCSIILFLFPSKRESPCKTKVRFLLSRLSIIANRFYSVSMNGLLLAASKLLDLYKN